MLSYDVSPHNGASGENAQPVAYQSGTVHLSGYPVSVQPGPGSSASLVRYEAVPVAVHVAQGAVPHVSVGGGGGGGGGDNGVGGASYVHSDAPRGASLHSSELLDHAPSPGHAFHGAPLVQAHYVPSANVVQAVPVATSEPVHHVVKAVHTETVSVSEPWASWQTVLFLETAKSHLERNH